MTQTDKPANEPEVAMARWDLDRQSDVDSDSWRHDCSVLGCSHKAVKFGYVRDTIADVRGALDRWPRAAPSAWWRIRHCLHHSATPEEIGQMRDRIAELEQVAIDQAEEIASIWGSE